MFRARFDSALSKLLFHVFGKPYIVRPYVFLLADFQYFFKSVLFIPPSGDGALAKVPQKVVSPLQYSFPGAITA